MLVAERITFDAYMGIAIHGFLIATNSSSCLVFIYLVFAGPVCWTGKKTEIELNPTAKDRTTGCGCTNFEFFLLPVATFVEKSKIRKKTGLSSRHVLDLTYAHFSLIVGL